MLDRGDLLVSVNGRNPTDRAVLDAIVGSLEPGESVEFRYQSRGSTFTETATATPDPALVGSWIPDGLASPEQRAFREAWKGATPR